MDFGSIVSGGSSSKLFTIRSTGTGDLSGLAVTLAAGGNPADFILGVPPVTTLAPGATTTFSVTFSPKGAGTRTATLQIASNGGDENPFEINLTGSQPPREIVVEQPSGAELTDGGTTPVNFGLVVPGGSAVLTFTIRNQGGSILTGLAVTLGASGNPGDFIIGALSTTTLPPNSATTFTVTFSPTAPGTRTATLQIASNDADENPFDITLNGTDTQTSGSLDLPFNTDVTGGYISGTVVQADGKILLVGTFTSVSGQPRNHIARLNRDGTVESTATFNPGTGVDYFSPPFYGYVYSVVVQADGKILLGGIFRGVNGQGPGAISRLLPDGTVESAATFNPTLNPSTSPGEPFVGSVAVQADGKILLGGGFTSVDGQPRNRIARVNPNGTIDSTFDPGTGVENFFGSVAVQADGKILLGGGFTSVNGQPRHGIARLLPDGTVESTATFNPGTGVDGGSVAVQADGKILLSGGFTSVNGQPRNRIARLNPDGSLETTLTFNPGTGVNGQVFCIAVQADGKILLGGNFTSVNGQPRDHIARLNPDGTLDSTFNPGAGSLVRSVAVQANGMILLGGQLGIARLANDAATQSLTVPSNSRVQWARGGAGPEVEQVTFELSTNNGSSWAPLGPGTRIPGGWERTGLNLPATRSIRARGRTSGGSTTSSSGLVEQTLNVPQIAVEYPPGSPLVDGIALMDFGTIVSGSSSSQLFTLRSTGTGDLTGLAVVLAAAGNPADFIIGVPAATTLAPGATTTFSVTFSPTGAGVRTATMQIASNDADENPFEINLTGSQATPLEAWRHTYFGTVENVGAAADLSDPDGDGIVNLLEYATATDPLKSTLLPGKLVKNGNTLEFTYTRRKAALAEMKFVREFSETLTGTWSQVAGLVETILSDDGILQQVKTTVPAGSTGKRFVRLRVTRL